MTKSYLRLIDHKLLIILILAFIASPILCGVNKYIICLAYSHYLTVYLNNIFLLFTYQYTYRLNQFTHPLITRIGYDRFYSHSYFFIVGMGFLYHLIIYIGYYVFFGPILPEDLILTICFMVINLMIAGIECSIIYLQLGKKKNFIYLVLPIFINFVFHFLWIKFF